MPGIKKSSYFNEKIKAKLGLAWRFKEFTFEDLTFRLSDHSDLIKSIHAGEFKINIAAATLVLKALVSIFAEINQSIELISADV